MAEEKKIEKKPSPPPAKKEDPFAELIWFLLKIFLLIYVLNGLVNMVLSTNLFSDGFSGFTPAGIMKSITRPIASLVNPIGEKVISIKDTDVYDSPGGKKIGSHKLGDRGKILQGPVIIDGEKYWYVDYEEGVDGWVKESDIAYLEKEPNAFQKFILWIYSSLSLIKLFSVILSIFLILFFIYLIRGLTRLRAESLAKLYPENQNVSGEALIVNVKWEKILEHIESLSQNDWKLAIIEADIMLDGILDKMGLRGDTVGDKLKSVEKSDFTTIDNAWEAHKIRNQIAHEGSDFVLNQREARRTIDLYRTVFEEFGII